jgi:hypothetical protein
MSNNERNTEIYAQIGVAMTCRSFEEYLLMFNLDQELLCRGPILDVAAGASSFTAGAAARGYKAVAADPLYALSPEQIREKGLREIQESTMKLASLKHILDWNYYGSIDRHKAGREAALEQFSQHFAQQDSIGSNGEVKSESDPKHTYVPAFLPKLPFANASFSLVLCSHFLFLYEEQFDEAFHEAALLELLRVCKPEGEVRVYPLLSLRWEPYAYLDLLMERIREYGVECRLVESHLPFIPGSTHLLALRPLTTP